MKNESGVPRTLAFLVDWQPIVLTLMVLLSLVMALPCASILDSVLEFFDIDLFSGWFREIRRLQLVPVAFAVFLCATLVMLRWIKSNLADEAIPALVSLIEKAETTGDIDDYYRARDRLEAIIALWETKKLDLLRRYLAAVFERRLHPADKQGSGPHRTCST